MMPKTTAALVVFCLALVAVPALASDALDQSDVRTLAEFFEGRFDSTLQHNIEAAAGLDLAERHPRVRLIHTRVTAPAIGANVLYVEELALSGETKILRRRVASFVLDTQAQAIRMKLFDVAATVTDVTAGLAPSQVTPLDGCDVVFHHSLDGAFDGAAEDKACRVPGAPNQYLRLSMTVAPLQIMRIERLHNLDTGRPTDGQSEDDTPAVHFRMR